MKSEISVLAPIGAHKSVFDEFTDGENKQSAMHSARSIGAAKFKRKKKRSKIAKISRKKNRG